MAEYLILIYGDEQKHANGGQELWDSLMQGHTKFAENNGTALRGGNALQETSTATAIRDGVVTDGPFAETKELIAGFWIWKVKSMDEALEWIKRAPFDGGTEIELRPFFEAEDFGAEFTPELRAQEARLRAEMEKRKA